MAGYMDNWLAKSQGLNTGTVTPVGLSNVVPSPTGTSDLWSMDRWLGSDKQAGILPVGAGVLGGLMQGWAGIQGMNLAKRQQKFNEGMAAVNLANQAALANEQLRTRQETRYRTAPHKQQAPDAFMQQWQVKGKI